MNCWVEVNLDAIAHNYRAISQHIGETTSIIAVVKANAYGHGAVEVARTLAGEGARMLAVTRLDEALPIRNGGILAPLLLLAPASPNELDELVAHNITAGVADFNDAQRLSDAAARRGVTAQCHLIVNTGMGRLGVEPEVAVETAARIAQLPNISLEAAFTHFAFAAEPDPSDTHHQFAKFQPLIHYIGRAAGVKPQSFHCANSAALLRFPAMRLSCVRPGTILYGQFPSLQAKEAAETQRLELRQGFAVKARVITVRTVKRGQTVGYGGEWRAARDSRIATIAVGYADGLAQEPSTRSFDAGQALLRSLKLTAKRAAQVAGLHGADAAHTVTIAGQRTAIIGRIAMQQCSFEVSDIEGVAVGDIVEVSMRRTSAGAHLPRVYCRDAAS